MVDRGLLERRWVHSHEEDTPSEMVFRPDTHKFPPSRGRKSFELRHDGTMAESRPGPDDRGAAGGGTWQLEGQTTLKLNTPDPAQRSVFDIVEIRPDKLVVRK